MPCDMNLSKLILAGIKLRIAGSMVDIASILMCQKDFFVHEEKR